MSTRAQATPRPQSPEPVSAASASPSLWRALVPGILLDSTPAEWLFKLPARKRQLLLLGVFAALILFPYLGAVGFWDPWEPEYDEVAREMIWRGDFIHPFYELGGFVSKPALSFWLMAIGQLVAGVNSGAHGISVYTEWCVRSIFAATALIGVLMTYLATARTIGQRPAVWAAVIVATSPYYFLIARQVMVDMPFICLNTTAIACFMIAVFEKESIQDGWLLAFYVLCGVAVMDKGLLGIFVPGGAIFLYLLLSGDWRILGQLRLVVGPILTLAMFAPWYGVMIADTRLLDYEDQVDFWQRFIIHDHFERWATGVHTTTPNTNFTYFIEQVGYGMFPWVALIPGAAGLLARPWLGQARTRRQKAQLFVISWCVFTFLMFSLSATKFHHYMLPLVPPLAILLGLYAVKVLEEGVMANIGPLALGAVFFILVGQNIEQEPKHLTDMFVYNYDRPYPSHEVDHATVFQLGHWTVTGQEVFGLLFGLGFLGMLLGAPPIRQLLASVMKLFRAKWDVREETRDRLFVMGALAILAFSSATYMSWYHWRKLSAHWSQRDIVWEYYEKAAPDDPFGAFQMNWKGETFYSRNTVRQLKSDQELRDFVAGPGNRKWIVAEKARLAAMKNLIGSGYDIREIDKTSVKYVLVTVTPRGA